MTVVEYYILAYGSCRCVGGHSGGGGFPADCVKGMALAEVRASAVTGGAAAATCDPVSDHAKIALAGYEVGHAAALRGTPGAGEAPRGLDSERIRYMALLDAARIVHERDPGSRAIADLVEEAASLVPLPFSATDAHWVALMAKYPAPATPVDRRRPAREVLDDIDELCERTRTDGPTSMSMGDAVAEIRKLVEADRRGEP